MTLLLAARFLLVVGLVGATVSATPTKECAYTNHRLPKHIVPKHYNLALQFETDEYNGEVLIELEVSRNEDKLVPNNIIVLHAHPDLEVSTVSFFDAGIYKFINDIEICRQIDGELLVIELEENLPDRATGELSLSFRGGFRDDKTGIYKTGYMPQAGANGYQISTDFEPNKARRAFPCFDEPLFKATFDIILKHNQAEVVLSNTNLISTKPDAGLYKSKFERTPPMSTYMVAFVIGEFDHIEKKLANRDLTIRAFTQVGKSERARFALDTAVRAIEHMEEYFNYPFPLKKLDMLSGIDLTPDARENWGLIVFKDSSFLFDEDATSPLSKAHIARTVVHQLALQWFGNLVTMKWWNDLWLTEGFAGFMELNLTDHLYPEFQVELHHLTETHQEALKFDSQNNVRSIRVAEDGRKIEANLDEMVYHKSVEVIRLLHDAYLGPEQFKLGIRGHISQHNHRLVDASDLWRDMKGDSELPVDKFIESWTEQAGHPIVKVQIVKNHERSLILEQKRERSSRWSVVNSRDKQTWFIPVTIRISGDRGLQDVQTYYLDKPKMEIDLPDWFKFRRGPTHWLKVNENSRGFYRVEYGGTNLQQRLKEPCKTSKLSKNDKIGLINDAKMYFQNYPRTFVKYREVLEWFKGEIDGSVLGEVARSYSFSRKLRPIIGQLGLELFAPAFHEFGLQNELFQYAKTPKSLAVIDIEGMIKAYEILIELNYRPFVEEALKKFDTERYTIVSRIRGVVYKTVAVHGSPEQLRILESSLYHIDSDRDEMNRILVALRLVPDSMKSHLLRSY